MPNLKDIMEDVLQLTSLQARRAEFNPIWLDLDALCRSILDEFQSQPGGAQRLAYSCNEALRAVKLDKKLTRQLMANLLSNAMKYSAADKTVWVSLTATSEKLVCQVRDEGIGIPAADLADLFEPFHRAANVDAIAGTDLGLAIAKEAVELHGGTIAVESQSGVRTTFTVTIPFMPSAEASSVNKRS
jgi:signal transduction histidine kinase